MKKYFGIFIILSMMIVGSTPNVSHAQTLTQEQIILVVSALSETGNYNQEQIVQIVLALATNNDQTSVITTDVVLDPGALCAFRYNGDESAMAVQQELQNQGYTITKVDGKIGPETRAAVEAFQAANAAVKVDGLIGQETRNLLVKNSVVCAGDPGVVANDIAISSSDVVVETAIDTGMTDICRFNYNGDESAMAVQQELQNQGYTITKVDGKIGPETRAAVEAFQAANALPETGSIDQRLRIVLSQQSVICNFETVDDSVDGGLNNQETDTVSEIAGTDQTVVVSTDNEIAPSTDVVVVGSAAELNQFVVKDEVLAAVRTSGQTPDDTAVFTYKMTLNPDSNIFVSTGTEATFDVNIYNAQGALVSVEQAKSIVSTAEKILRDDRTSYYRIKKGDTLSLRSTAQPGPGVYYAELGRFTYTTDNALTVLNPSVVNYGLDASVWRSGTITLQN